MIGVVGSVDSVSLVSQVAQQMALGETLMTRAYGRPEDAPGCAEEIDAACNVILFTGRVPFVLTESRVELTAMSDYIPHSGVDLFRSLVVLLKRFGGELPRVSIDTIDGAVVRENFAEVGLRPPVDVFDSDPVLQRGTGTEAIADFHKQLFRNGAVDLCITCLSAVRDKLDSISVPVERVEHSHGSVRDSLLRATLTSQLQRSEASQIAVLSIAGLPETISGEVAPNELFRALAGQLQGDLLSEGRPTPTIASTRGAVERELGRQGGLLQTLDRMTPAGAWLGVGLGHSLAQADEQSRYAHTVAAATRAHHVVLPDGTVRRLQDGTNSRLRIGESGERLRGTARLAGIGPMSLYRLQATLATLGRSDVTAKELARAYGVEPRSARRLLNALLNAGVAVPHGAQSAPRAGRPQVIYKIDLEALLAITPNGPIGTAVSSQKDSDY